MPQARHPNPADASLKGKVILITGAGSGIGAATAVELQRRGAIPVLADCDADALAIANAMLDPTALTITGDVTLAGDCEDMVASTLAQYGRLDVIWANAGIASFGPLAHTDPLAWRRCIDVNVFGVFNTVRAALPEIVRTKGFVVVSASVSSFAHPPGVSAYAASKAAVEAMSNAWRIELSAHGVGVGVIHASWIRTPLVTEGNMHPGFRRLRATMPAVLNREVDAAKAAQMIADGIERRSRQIWVPGWVKALHWLRAFLHSPLGERELIRAAPEIESLFLEGLQTSTVKASSFPPRELARAIARGDASG
jgi:NAD(P)-dependent dehydrogenase (short-subunit alcohol dehydrogenase family)